MQTETTMNTMTTGYLIGLGRSLMNLRRVFLLAILWLGLWTVPQAPAGYHFWDINEIYSNEDGSVQFVELRALSGGQNFMAGAVTIRSTNSAGLVDFTCSTNLPSDTASKTCIIGTASLASIPGGVVPNYIIPPNFIRRPTGSGSAAVIFLPAGFPGQNVAAVYSSIPTNGDGAILRSGGFVAVTTNSPKNFINQSNSIVPVKILSTSAADTNFVLSFRTATGVNGSAGPNYTVQSNDAPGSTNWNTLTTVAGNGTTRSATNALSNSTNRIFRLRVP